MTTIQRFSNHALIAIGFRIANAEEMLVDVSKFDIESTLLDVIEAFREDYRIASVLMSWIKAHGNYVIVEKLLKLHTKAAKEFGQSFPWMTFIAAWAVECGYHKWRKLTKKEKPPVYLYDPEVSESAILRKGIVSWAEPYGYRIPQNSLRMRETDVLTPRELIQCNPQYKNRYLFGSSWRADIVTAIQRGISSPTELCRTVGCSYEPAYRISHEYLMASNITSFPSDMT